MNSQQIAYFLEVVRQGSFTKAAQVLYTSQPSLSRQIARLEDEFGAELFCRSRTGAVLSPIGKKYYDLFVEMEKRLAELSMEAKRESLQLEKSVHIGVPEGWDVLPLIEKMEALLSVRGEELKMTFSAYSYRLLLSQLRNHQIDGCICPKGLIVPLEHMAFLDLPPLQNVLLYSRKHCPPGKPGPGIYGERISERRNCCFLSRRILLFRRRISWAFCRIKALSLRQKNITILIQSCWM